MRIVFMGTPAFAVPALEALITARHDIAGVYTQPPKPAGRGHKIHYSAVQHCADRYGIGVRCPKNFKAHADIEILCALNADIGVVAAYGLILPQAVLDAPRLGCLNIHGSLLPRWRGAAPIHRALLAGDVKTGITIMRMEAGLDTGPMLLTGETPIDDDDTVLTLHDRLSVMGADLVVKVLAALDTYPAVTQPQDNVTYAHKINKDEGVLRGHETAQMIDKMLRAFTPWPFVWLTFGDKRFKILAAKINHAATHNNVPFGTLLNRDGDMAAGENTVVQLLSIQAPNGKTMTPASAINGGLMRLHI